MAIELILHDRRRPLIIRLLALSSCSGAKGHPRSDRLAHAALMAPRIAMPLGPVYGRKAHEALAKLSDAVAHILRLHVRRAHAKRPAYGCRVHQHLDITDRRRSFFLH